MSFIFKIKLKGSEKPAIWRKIKVNESLTFGDFRQMIQVIFGWKMRLCIFFLPKAGAAYPK